MTRADGSSSSESFDHPPLNSRLSGTCEAKLEGHFDDEQAGAAGIAYSSRLMGITSSAQDK